MNPNPNELTMKWWSMDEAQKNHVTREAIMLRLARGEYPDLNIRRINKRVVFVSKKVVDKIGIAV